MLDTAAQQDEAVEAEGSTDHRDAHHFDHRRPLAREQLRAEDRTTTSEPKRPPVFRMRADLRSSSASTSAQEEERPLTRHHRSARRHGAAAASEWPFGHHHRRRRKGCPPLHGKEQLLCPSRNAHRYDVCISREQICDHTADCPNGEDEDPQMCFFYKSLDNQLKTLSHAVLLLVDNVMNEQKTEL
ncbi:hypothetical protein M3Y99_01654800 [Aphelenchoides fujianensis]|nr:hypothetical protein M3Y99_01654800 [Aphelenchoides fujianensis]